MLSRYQNISSKIHQMNALAKLICLILFVIMTFLTNNIRFQILLGILLLLIIFSSNVSIKIYLKTTLNIKYLILFIILINIILKQDFLIIILRLIYIVLYSSVLLFTTTTNEINYGLTKLLSPIKIIPANKISLSISLSLRFIPNIFDEGKRIIKAQKLRGLEYNTLKNKILAIKNIILPMFILSFKRADNVADTMETRLYDINKKTFYRINKWKVYDTFLIIIHLSILILIIRSML